MAFAIPDFQDSRLNSISVCALFHADSDDRLVGIDQGVLLRSSVDPSLLVQLQVDKYKDAHGHLHIDMEKVGDSKPDSFKLVPFSEMESALDRFTGQKVDARVSAEYLVPLEDLPENGILMTLLGVSTESCGAYLCLEGAKMSIVGDTFTQLIWSIDDDGDSVRAKLSAETESEVDAEYLTRLTQLMHEGFDCFVLESNDKYAYATRSRSKSRSMQEIADA